MSNGETPPKFKVDWTFSVPDIIAIVGVMASIVYSQATINSRVDVVDARQAILAEELKDLKLEYRIDQRDLQVQLRALNTKMDMVVGAHSAGQLGSHTK